MKAWIVLVKQEMTKLWVNDVHTPVTLLKLIDQEVIRKKTVEVDWYNAVVVGVQKKEVQKDKWQKVSYKMVCEFKLDQQYFDAVESGTALDLAILQDVDLVTIIWTTKGKGYQWVVRRHWFAWWRATHGSKFHRLPWSIWNRKPRRVNAWHPLPWHMGLETVKLKNVSIIDTIDLNWEKLLAVKWSVPWFYNSLLKVQA